MIQWELIINNRDNHKQGTMIQLKMAGAREGKTEQQTGRTMFIITIF